ncbi:flagellar hook-associated protein FlgL [Anaerocolumna sp. AGMB13025]|uniref:flagellar hook-associated protein FlgL n=1 Tax=Anaerocolumna sp. AGMB13025 TaxID=3039116 RepID=UPI00241F457E|nr:flagellar hook-associated protein FlgL [Anaerocolumna sp. AGMB13025]WFR56808.1 flagellar hook-associated protein FlgL [Anaerocolumna sp. AGMB13025]
MRITNQMMTNNMMNSINKNKNNLSALDAQYASGKKIQRPSEDPIVAVRALKLRTNLAELNQYYEKNIPDAKSWMDVTEGALTNINSILTNINTACVQGSSDPLSADDRESIIKNLEQYKEQIYQEGNANYAGRYVFTGYKTDTSLIFDKPSTDLEYTITENFSGKNIESISKVSGTYSVDDYDPSTDYSASPTMNTSYRIRLSYDNLDMKMPDGVTDVDLNGKVTALDKTGAAITVPHITTKSASDPTAYQPVAGEINYIPETGELILSDGANNTLKNAASISVDYRKTNFKEGDLRPEHYFDSDVHLTGSPVAEDKHYTKQDQDIQYEINFNQKLTVNTQGSDALQHNIGRDIDEILKAVQDVKAAEQKIADVDKMLADPNYANQTDKLNQLKQQLKTELTLKNDIMQKKFGSGITHSNESQNTVNVAIADLGSRYVRLELTENRLSDQQVEFTDLMSTNEDVDMVETYIKYNSAEVIYNASLSAASKVVQNTLLDFL